MSRVCELTGQRPDTGNLRSHSNIKTRTRWLPNLKTKRYRIHEIAETVTVTLSARAIRTIDKQGGMVNALFEAKQETLSPTLLKLKNTLIRRSRKAEKAVEAKTAVKKAAKKTK